MEIEEIINPIKVKSVANTIEADLLINYLLNNNIACFKKSRDAGEYLNIYMGYSIFGEDIFVDQKDYQIATDLLSDITSNDELITEEDDIEIHRPFYKNPRLLARIMLVVLVGYVILTILF